MGEFFGLVIGGLLLGLLARLIVPGRQPIGCLLTMVVGVVGAVTGGYLGREVLNFGGLGTFVVALLVTAVLVLIVANLTGRHDRR